jgi:hypothetical protein
MPTLRDLKEGQEATIIRVGGSGALRRRLLEMGLRSGAHIRWNWWSTQRTYRCGWKRPRRSKWTMSADATAKSDRARRPSES